PGITELLIGDRIPSSMVVPPIEEWMCPLKQEALAGLLEPQLQRWSCSSGGTLLLLRWFLLLLLAQKKQEALAGLLWGWPPNPPPRPARPAPRPAAARLRARRGTEVLPFWRQKSRPGR